MWAKFCKWLLIKVMGWTRDGGPAPEKKVVILGVPHTSMWDFVVSYLFYTSFGKHAKVMIKKDMFIGPLGWLLRKLGGVPVDRTSSAAMIKDLIEEMEKCDEFHLAIAPEGTRKAIKKWKNGYHLIAKETGATVYLGYFDWGTKHIGIGVPFEISDDARADTEKIQAYYETLHMTGKHPEGYITH